MGRGTAKTSEPKVAILLVGFLQVYKGLEHKNTAIHTICRNFAFNFMLQPFVGTYV